MAHDKGKLDLYLSRRSALVDYAAPIVGDRMLAEDVVQEAWLRFSAAPAQARAGSAGGIMEPAAYLYRIVRNLAIDLSRKLTAEAPQASGDLALEDLPAEIAGPEREATGRSQLQMVAAALDQLPERTRRAFDLHRFGDKTFAEIGQILGISQARAHALVKEAVAHCTAALMGGRAP